MDQFGNEITLEYKFLAHCVKRRQEAMKEKCRILKPLLDAVESFRSAFFHYFIRKGFFPDGYVYVPGFFTMMDLGEQADAGRGEGSPEAVAVEDERCEEPVPVPEPEPGPSARIARSPYTRRRRRSRTATSSRAAVARRYYDNLWVRASSSDESVRLAAQAIIDKRRGKARAVNLERAKKCLWRSPKKKTPENMESYRRMIKRCEDDYLMLKEAEERCEKEAAARKRKLDNELIGKITSSWKGVLSRVVPSRLCNINLFFISAGSIFGMIERHLESLIKAFVVWGFNCEVIITTCLPRPVFFRI